MATTRNGDTRRSPKKDEFIKGILDGYHVTDGCSPFAQHWGGHDLAKTDWLKRFAEQIADNNNGSLEAWNTLKTKCDTSFIIELLYLMTIPSRSLSEESRDSDHAVAAEIERILPKYVRLLEDIHSVIQDPRVSACMPYAQLDLAKESQTLRDSKQRLEVLRDYYKGFGSRKRNQRDWYLHLLDSHVSDATGHSHAGELTTLIDTARAAHNEHEEDSDLQDEVSDEGTLTKRIRRYRQFLNSQVSIRNRNNIFSPADPSDPIPF